MQKKFDDMFIPFDTIPACDRQTDMYTSCDSKVRRPRWAYASRGKKWWANSHIFVGFLRKLAVLHRVFRYRCCCRLVVEAANLDDLSSAWVTAAVRAAGSCIHKHLFWRCALSSVFTARRVCIARIMLWQDVRPSVRPSVTRRYLV